MVAPAHIRIGAKALADTSINSDFRIYKIVYLFGCIAPDINFVYPLHNIVCTPKRFQKRIIRMKKIKSKIIRSFTLGVIMHYICDYFCIAHNNQSYGARHTLYERIMSRKLGKRALELGWNEEKLGECWKLAVDTFETGEIDFFDILVETKYTISNDIFKVVKQMNNIYLEKVSNLAKSNWYTDEWQMNFDISWALFMCEKVSLMIYGEDMTRLCSV